MASILRKTCIQACTRDGLKNILKTTSIKIDTTRGMARSRNYPIQGASLPTGFSQSGLIRTIKYIALRNTNFIKRNRRKTDHSRGSNPSSTFMAGGISEEVRDLLANVKTAENMDEWNRNPKDPDPIAFQPLRPNPGDIDNDQFIDMKYYPHRGEDLSEWEKEPSPVLLVERVKTLKNEPWWHKETCEKFGLGIGTHAGKRVAVPNMSHYNYRLYTVKHLIKVTPVQFPEGLPSEEEFDPRAAEVTHDGKFVYHKMIKNESEQIEDGLKRGERMAIQRQTYGKQGYWDFTQPWSTPLGNHNYNRNSAYRHPEKKNRVTDSAHKIQY